MWVSNERARPATDRDKRVQVCDLERKGLFVQSETHVLHDAKDPSTRI